MNRSIGLWQLVGFSVTSLLGTVLHFLYDWLDKAIWIAPFSGVNESTWEHMKLLFWPMLLFAVIQSLFFTDRNDFWCVKLRGIALGLVLIPIIFYTYNGVIGRSPDWINIAIFFVAAGAAYIYEARRFEEDDTLCINSRISIALLCLIAILFIVFTFKAPHIGIFIDPITASCGK